MVRGLSSARQPHRGPLAILLPLVPITRDQAPEVRVPPRGCTLGATAPVRRGPGGSAMRPGAHAGKGIPYGANSNVVQADVLGGSLRDRRRHAPRSVWRTAESAGWWGDRGAGRGQWCTQAGSVL